jgi:alpha-glucosidase
MNISRFFSWIESVPTNWQKAVVPNAEIGKYLTIARKDRNSENWYLGSVTDQNARDITLSLSFLDRNVRYRAEIYADGPGADYRTNPYPMTYSEKNVDSETVLKMHLAPSGGCCIRFIKL